MSVVHLSVRWLSVCLSVCLLAVLYPCLLGLSLSFNRSSVYKFTFLLFQPFLWVPSKIFIWQERSVNHSHVAMNCASVDCISGVCKQIYYSGGIRWPSCPKDAQNMINTNCVRDLTARIKLGRKMRKSDVSRRECNFMTLSTSNQVSGVLWDSGWADGLRRWTVGCFWPQVADFMSCTESCEELKKVLQMLFIQIRLCNSRLSLVNLNEKVEQNISAPIFNL